MKLFNYIFKKLSSVDNLYYFYTKHNDQFFRVLIKGEKDLLNSIFIINGMYSVKLRNIIISFCSIFMLASCLSDNDCPECFTPPESLQLRIIDKNNSQDLLFNGTYQADSIRIVYLTPDGEQSVEYQLYTDSVLQRSLIVSYQISWESAFGFKEFLLHLNSSETDTIYLNVEEKHTECCTYFEWVNFEINGTEPDFDIENYFYVLSK